MNFKKKRFKKSDSKELKLQTRVKAIQSLIEEGNLSSNKAVEAAIEEIQAHPEMPVGEFMKRLQQNTDLSDKDLVKIIKQLPDVKSEEATVAAVKSTDLPPQALTDIIDNTTISISTAKKIVEQIPDTQIQQEQQAKIEKILEEEQRQKDLEEENRILKSLSDIYENCENTEALQLVDKINLLHIDTKTQKISDMLTSILAKRAALDCLNYGNPRIRTLTRIIPALDLIDMNLPLLIQKEYKTIQKNHVEQDKKYHEYGFKEKKLVKNMLLEEVAQKSAQTFDDIGDFNIPRTEYFQNLDDEDISIFINTVKTYSKDFTDSDSQRLLRQLNGETSAELQDLNMMLEKMKPTERDLAIHNIFCFLKGSIEDNKTQQQKEITEAIETIGLKLQNFPYPQQLSIANTIINVLDEKKESQKMWKTHKKNNLEGFER